MTNLRDAQLRSTLMSERIRQRTDDMLRELIAGFTDELDFYPLDDMMISEQAWEYVTGSGIEPKLVFAHPSVLQKHPRASQYYRGIALLPQKRVADIAAPVYLRGKTAHARHRSRTLRAQGWLDCTTPLSRPLSKVRPTGRWRTAIGTLSPTWESDWMGHSETSSGAMPRT